MLVDDVNITVCAGHGGKGLVSFGKKEHSGPDGGNGGKGGDVYLQGVNDITLLRDFVQKNRFDAQRGEDGGRNKRHGKDGVDLYIKVPVGVSIIDLLTNETITEIQNGDETFLICKGGVGGRGNWEFRSSRNTTPMYAQPGIEGECREIKLLLKLIADFGLIGLPNSGKSSLLNELTNAKAKVGNYAFTTLEPNLGVFEGKIIADIPGLIERASEGKGLGISFLKHIEKTKVLIHCVSSESENILEDYKTIREELKNYNKELLKKKELILVTKSDLMDENKKKEIEDKFNKKKLSHQFISIHDYNSIENLTKTLKKYF